MYFGLHISKTAKTVGRLAQFPLVRSGPNLHKILTPWAILLIVEIGKFRTPDFEKWGFKNWGFFSIWGFTPLGGPDPDLIHGLYSPGGPEKNIVIWG